MAPSLTTFATAIVASIGGWQLYEQNQIVQEVFLVAPPTPPTAIEKLEALCEAYTGPALLSCPHIIAIAATVKESWPFDDQTSVGVAVLGDLILLSLFGFCLRRCRGAPAKRDVSVDAPASVGAGAKADSDVMLVSYGGCSCSAAAALHLQEMAETMSQGAGSNETGSGKLTEANGVIIPEVNGCWPKAADQIEENTVGGRYV